MKRIYSPCTSEDLSSLKCGDQVLLSGIIYTARDQGHKRIVELINSNKELPFDISGSAVYYVGPTPEKPGQVIGAAGPTTSKRMDKYTPILLEHGNKIIIGKGQRNNEVIESIKKNKAIYLGAVGGAGAIISSCIKNSEIIAWDDLGCEALRKLTVEDMPLTVLIDSDGGNLYETGPENYRNSLRN